MSFGRAEHDEIDAINILQASLLSMKRAITSLTIEPEMVLVDGIYCPDINYKVEAIIKGDNKIRQYQQRQLLLKLPEITK